MKKAIALFTVSPEVKQLTDELSEIREHALQRMRFVDKTRNDLVEKFNSDYSALDEKLEAALKAAGVIPEDLDKQKFKLETDLNTRAIYLWDVESMKKEQLGMVPLNIS